MPIPLRRVADWTLENEGECDSCPMPPDGLLIAVSQAGPSLFDQPFDQVLGAVEESVPPTPPFRSTQRSFECEDWHGSCVLSLDEVLGAVKETGSRHDVLLSEILWAVRDVESKVDEVLQRTPPRTRMHETSSHRPRKPRSQAKARASHVIGGTLLSEVLAPLRPLSARPPKPSAHEAKSRRQDSDTRPGHCSIVTSRNSLASASGIAKPAALHAPCSTRVDDRVDLGNTPAEDLFSPGSTQNPCTSPLETGLKEHHFVGKWVDRNGKFYDGAVIHIWNDGWKPVERPGNPLDVFSVTTHSASRVDLIDIPADGRSPKLSFSLQRGPQGSGTLQVRPLRSRGGGDGSGSISAAGGLPNTVDAEVLAEGEGDPPSILHPISQGEEVSEHTPGLTKRVDLGIDEPNAEMTMGGKGATLKKTLFRTDENKKMGDLMASHVPSSRTRISLFLQEEVNSDTMPDWNEDGALEVMRYFLDLGIRSTMFEYCMGTIILANSVTLGVVTNLSIPTEGTSEGTEVESLTVLENVFLTIYVLEILAKMFLYGFSNFRNSWFLFDFFLVVTGVMYSWVLEPILASSRETGSRAAFFDQILVFRTLRLLRLIRALRVIPWLRPAWTLVYGLLLSSSTMISTMALICLCLYIFACVGVEVITKDAVLRQDASLDAIIDEHFTSVPTTMLTLFQFVTADSVAAIYSPLIKAKWFLMIYFFPIVLVVSIALMNLVTAVLVEGALQQMTHDRDAHKAQTRKYLESLKPVIKEFYETLDIDGNGYIDLAEIATVGVDSIPSDLEKFVKVDSMMHLFELLDVDASNYIDEREFRDGILNLCLAESGSTSTDTLLMLKLMKFTRLASDEMLRILQELSETLTLSNLQNTCRVEGREDCLS